AADGGVLGPCVLVRAPRPRDSTCRERSPAASAGDALRGGRAGEGPRADRVPGAVRILRRARPSAGGRRPPLAAEGPLALARVPAARPGALDQDAGGGLASEA